MTLTPQERAVRGEIPPLGHDPTDIIRYQQGTDQFDELVMCNVNVHIEQLDADVYWICIDRGENRVVVNIAPAQHVKRHVPLNGYVIENDLDVKETR